MSSGQPETIRSAVRVLRDGGVVGVPTDTVYGIVALHDDERGLRRLIEAKGRPSGKPLPLLLGTAADLPLVAEDVADNVWPLIYAHWPGPLTIVFPAKAGLSRTITAGTGTVGTRVPAHPAVLDLLEALRLPLASTSANQSGSAPAMTPGEVLEQLGSRVDLVIDQGRSPPAGAASTVLDLTTRPFLIRRRGDVTPAQIRQALNARVDIASDA